jgi:TfoX/Sxy family transcriptional regulator of competence genes
MAYDEKDAERVRRILSHDRPLVEKTMMAGLVFMVHGHMCCGLSRGTLMVRVGRENRERMLTLPHVRPMKIGGRSPAAFVRIDPEGYRTDQALVAWIQRGIDFVSTLPAKMPAAKKAGRKAAPGKTTSRMMK